MICFYIYVAIIQYLYLAVFHLIQDCDNVSSLELTLAGATSDGVRLFVELLYLGRTHFNNRRQQTEVQEVITMTSEVLLSKLEIQINYSLR